METKKKKPIVIHANLLEIGLIAITFLALGIVLGMTIQQLILEQGLIDIAGNLEGVEVNIDFNETQLIEGIQGIGEQMIQDMNKSIWELNRSKSKELSDKWAEWEKENGN